MNTLPLFHQWHLPFLIRRKQSRQYFTKLPLATLDELVSTVSFSYDSQLATMDGTVAQ